MKKLASPLTLLVACALTCSAALYIPPDFYQQKYMPSIGFWANLGQVIDTQGNKREDVKFYTTGSIPQVYLRTNSRVSFVIHKVDSVFATTDTAYRLDMQPWGDYAAQVEPVGEALKTSHLNYFLPHCGVNGVPQVPGYSRVVYENLFPDIDLHFYSGGFGQKMAFVCRPGSNPDHLLLRFTGQDSLNQDLWDNLKFYHDGKYFVLPHAAAYQVNPDSTIMPVPWNAQWDPDEDAGTVKFEWGAYDPEKPLVFLVGPPPAMGGQVNTPGVCWSTYLGGDGIDRIYASDTDDDGNYYVGGFTYSQVINFPIIPGVVTFEASPIALAAKFGTGYEALWSTYYGGSNFVSTSPHQLVRGLAVRPGSDPNIVIGGRSATSNLWCINPLDGSFYDDDGSGGGFLAELDHEGVILWSTYFGNGLIAVINIDLHSTGAIGVCGSVSGGSIPPEQDAAPPQAEHWNYGGNGDGWIALLKPERRTYWCTFIGGTEYEFLRSVRFGADKVVFMGSSGSSNFPLWDGGLDAHDEPLAGSDDITISEFTLDGDLQWSTFLGGSGGETPGYQGLAIRPSGLGDEDIYIVGSTASSDFPMTPGGGWHNPDYGPGNAGAAFIARFSGSDRSRLWSTYVNGASSTNGGTFLDAVTVDRADRLFVAGHTLTDGFHFQDAWQLYSTDEEFGAWDGVLMCFDANQELRWSTRYGGEEAANSTGERIETLAAWSDERLYAAGYTYTLYGPQTFFPFTDPVGDDDFFDDVFYPEDDAFLVAFCTEGLLTSLSETAGASGLVATLVAPGVFDLGGLPAIRTIVRVVDAAGRLIQQHASRSADRLHIDLTGEAVGAYVVQVVGVGAITLHHTR